MASPADIKAIFLAATEKPQADRAAYLADACGNDSGMRRRVEALLKAHDNTGGWLGETATPTSDYPGFSAPSIEELAPHFPHLEILELLGQGGMGAVYKARQKNLDRLVALKILPHDAGDRGFAERFTREARTLAKLNHPGIVAIHDFGSTGDLYWFVMEFVNGVNLRQAKKAGSLTPATALAVVPQICEALQYAHDAGIVHRDIKPENVLLDAKGGVKIADFGLAKLIGRPDRSHLTGTNQAMGTPHYMAPEQWEKPLEVDHRADIYSLGVVFYELLTGELPLGRFAPPSQKVQVDVRLDEVVLRSLEKEPARRYQQASEVKTDVERIGATNRPESIHTSSKRVVSESSSIFRRVLLLPLILFVVAVVIPLLVYSLVPKESWDRGVRENFTAVVVISAWVCGLVLVVNSCRWFFSRRREAMAERRLAIGPATVEMAASARRHVAAPSCGLLLVGVATLLISLGIVAFSATTLVRIYQSNADASTQNSGSVKVSVKPHVWTPYKPLIAGTLILHAIAAGLGGVIVFAAISMRRLELLGFAQAGSLLAILPVSIVWPAGFCVGLWSLLTLRRPEVEAAFDRRDVPEQQPIWKLTPSFAIAIGACLLGLVASFLPWSQLSFFGMSFTSFGFDMWNGIVAGTLFLIGALLLIGFEMKSADRVWRLAGSIGIAAMIGLVLGAYFWEATRPTKVTSSTGDDLLKPMVENFFIGSFSGSLLFGPFVSAFAVLLFVASVLAQGRSQASETEVRESAESSVEPVRIKAAPLSLTNWAIVVCLIGIVNVWFPWYWASTTGQSFSLSSLAAPQDWWQLILVVGLAFLVTGFLIYVTSVSDRLRTLRIVATFGAGILTLILTAYFIVDLPRSIEGSLGPSAFLSLGLSGALLVISSMDLRERLANRDRA